MGTPPCSLSVFSGPSLPNQPCTLSSLQSVWLLLHRRCHTRTTQPNTSLLTRCLYESHAKWQDHRLHILQTRRLQQILPMELLLCAVHYTTPTNILITNAVGRVKIQTYRGPSKGDYDFAPWGYYNTQPADLALHH